MNKMNLMNNNYHVIKKQKKKPIQKTFNFEKPKLLFDTTKHSALNELLGKVHDMTKKKEKNEKSQEQLTELDYNLEDIEIHCLSENVKQIINVYQPTYKNDKNATGFGDFIRGSYFLMQFCETFNLKFNILINHPLQHFLKNNGVNTLEKNEIPNYENIVFYQQVKIEGFLDENNFNYFLNTSENTNEQRNVFINTYLYPSQNVSQKHKENMRNILEPIPELTCQVNNVLSNLKLERHSFNIIHIRSGDKYLIDNSLIDPSFIKKLVNVLYFLNNKETYLLLTDSYKLKYILMKLFPRLKMFFNEITHFGEGVELNNEKVKNTLVDFYLMASSKKIFSFSIYEHGSGFSRWCAETYNIPYVGHILK
jgi:hypothetical protein